MGSDQRGSVIMQARVRADFAAKLTKDAEILGLDGTSELVREGLRMLHRRAREKAAVAELDRFYGGKIAPLPTGVIADDSI